MNLKNSKYTKAYISETDEEDVSHHGSPTWIPYQKINTEDEKIRKKIIKSFKLKEEGEGISKKYLGFDGEFMYFFSFRPYSDRISDLGEKENKEYTSAVFIQKTGNVEFISHLCDLEKFLLEKKFQPQR